VRARRAFEFVAVQAPADATQAAPAAPAEAAPASGPPPRFVKVQGLGDKLVLRETVVTSVYAAPPAAEGAAPAEAAPPLVEEAFAWNSRIIGAGDFRLFSLDGKALDAAATRQRLSQPIIALLSHHGKKVDPAWLSIYQSEIVLVYVKPEAMQGGHGHGIMIPPQEAMPAEAPPPAAKRPLRMATPEELEQLLAAAAKADDERVTQLLNDGLDINQQNAEGETALMRAAANGHNGYVETLIMDHKADPALRNKAGKSAEQLAREKGHDATADAIADHLK
jgi:hypothetical protein